MFERLTLVIAAIAVLGFADGLAQAQVQKPVVSLLLSKATAERGDRDILFRCEAILDNASGKEISVRSNFSSAFDGLELVATMSDGTILAQQGYSWHQSPVELGREFTLKKGRNDHTLVFPITGLPADSKTFKVRLVGTLPGSEYKRILSSETMEIKVK